MTPAEPMVPPAQFLSLPVSDRRFSEREIRGLNDIGWEPGFMNLQDLGPAAVAAIADHHRRDPAIVRFIGVLRVALPFVVVHDRQVGALMADPDVAYFDTE